MLTPASPMSSAPRSTRRATTQLNRDDLIRLISECDAVLKLEPHCLHTRAVRGHSYMKAKLWDHAIQDFSVILNFRPDDVHGLFSRGMAKFKSGRVEDAHVDFSRVLELNPHHVMARYARAGCYNTEGKFHDAIEEYTIALQHDEIGTTMMSAFRWSFSREWQSEAAKSMVDRPKADEHTLGNAAYGRRANVETMQQNPQKQIEGDIEQELVKSGAQPQVVNDGKVVAAKKPRKVVQVKLNLSDFGASSAPTAQAPLSQQPEARTLPIDLTKRSTSTATQVPMAIPGREPQIDLEESAPTKKPLMSLQPRVETRASLQPVRRVVRHVTISL